MGKFYFWDIDMDCPIKEDFEGTTKQAKLEAIKLAKKWHTTVGVSDANTHEDLFVVDANGNDLYI